MKWSCRHHSDPIIPRSLPDRPQPTRHSPRCASYIFLQDVLLSVSSYPFDIFNTELYARCPVIRILLDSECQGKSPASLQSLIILCKIEANNLEDVLRAFLTCQKPNMLFLET